VLIWWPMISEIVFESRMSVHFNHYPIKLNLLINIVNLPNPPYVIVLCLNLKIKLWMKILVVVM